MKTRPTILFMGHMKQSKQIVAIINFCCSAIQNYDLTPKPQVNLILHISR